MRDNLPTRFITHFLIILILGAMVGSIIVLVGSGHWLMGSVLLCAFIAVIVTALEN